MADMARVVSRRSFLAMSAAALGGAAFAAPPEAVLRPALRPDDFFKRAVTGAEALVARARLDGQVAFAVADAASGLWLEGMNADVPATPASVAKAITALYTLDVLGPGHRFATRLIATGPVANGRIDGDLVLAGGGDPTLDTNDLAAMAAALKAQGISGCSGRFIVAEGYLPRVHSIDAGQPDHVGYSPAVSGIALNFNRVHFEWRRAGSDYKVTMDARSDRYRPDVSFARMELAERRVPVYTYRDTGAQDAWSVARPALGKGGARWLPVRKPGLYAGDVFRTLAAAEGIVLGAPQVVGQLPPGAALVTHKSAPLREICVGMLRYSNNLIAEMIGMSATRARLGAARSLRASAAEMNVWARGALEAEGFDLVDHSGLGGDSRMTAEAMVKALVEAHRHATLAPILKKIVMKDSRGRPVKDHPLEVRAKTGTLNFVSGLAGYLTAPDGTVLAFAIFAEDEATRARISRANRESPQGARSWNTRAKKLQQSILERWAALYGT